MSAPTRLATDGSLRVRARRVTVAELLLEGEGTTSVSSATRTDGNNSSSSNNNNDDEEEPPSHASVVATAGTRTSASASASSRASDPQTQTRRLLPRETETPYKNLVLRDTEYEPTSQHPNGYSKEEWVHCSGKVGAAGGHHHRRLQ